MFAAVALIGCNRENTPITPQEQHAISFGTVDTRAGLSDLQANGFDVWATVSSIGSTDVSYQPILTEELVKYVPASDQWTYANEQLWIPNSIFHFFAAYPHNIGFEQHTATQNGVNYTAYTLDVTADGSAATEDILVATQATDTSAQGFDPDDVVNLSFGHLLTKFNLTISQNTSIDSEFEYYVTKVTIEGLMGQCTYLVMPLNKSFMTAWDIEHATFITLGQDYDSAPVCLREPDGEGRKSKPLKVWGSDGIMLIPHDIAENGVKIRVDYLYDVDPNDTDLGQEKFIEGYIPPITWQSSTSINYNISIANTSLLTFDKPTIEPWGSPQTGGTIIIK